MQASELEPLVGGFTTDVIDAVVPEGDEQSEVPEMKVTYR